MQVNAYARGSAIFFGAETNREACARNGTAQFDPCTGGVTEIRVWYLQQETLLTFDISWTIPTLKRVTSEPLGSG